MNVSLAFLDKLSQYRSGMIDLAAFRAWQVNQSMNSDALEADDKKFLAAFEGRYAELSDNLISEQQFRQFLGSLVAPVQAGTALRVIEFYGTTVTEPSTVLKKPAYPTSSNPMRVFVEPEYCL